MNYVYLKKALIDMFDSEKLQKLPGEWGFFNETDRNIRCVGYATNLSREIIRDAGMAGVDFLLTHHDSWDFIYGLKDCCNQMLKEYGMTHAYFHAPLDDAEFGTSASLAMALGMKERKKVMPYMDIYYGGVTGVISPVGFEEFRGKLMGILKEDVRCYQNNDKPIHKIAVAAGGGNMTGEMKIAADNGCDTYVTGEYVLYSQQYAQLSGMNLFVGSHTNTEILGVESMAGKLCMNSDLEMVRIMEPNY